MLYQRRCCLDTQLDFNYYRPSIDDILTEYLKAVDSLTINEEYRLKRKVNELTNETKDSIHYQSKTARKRDRGSRIKGKV